MDGDPARPWSESRHRALAELAIEVDGGAADGAWLSAAETIEQRRHQCVARGRVDVLHHAFAAAGAEVCDTCVDGVLGYFGRRAVAVTTVDGPPSSDQDADRVATFSGRLQRGRHHRGERSATPMGRYRGDGRDGIRGQQ